jgi:hypothetical protein
LPYGTFPTAPSRTGQAPFNASGSPGLRRSLRFPAYPLTVRGIHRTIADVLRALQPFTLSWALPQAFGSYDGSATLRVSPWRWSRSSHRALVRTSAPLDGYPTRLGASLERVFTHCSELHRYLQTPLLTIPSRGTQIWTDSPWFDSQSRPLRPRCTAS